MAICFQFIQTRLNGALLIVCQQYFVVFKVKGKKRFVLFSPEQFSKLYPYPVGHPHDRQSQVDFNKPDFQKFPKFRLVDALEAILEPGDLLYLPTNWWHYVESFNNK